MTVLKYFSKLLVFSVLYCLLFSLNSYASEQINNYEVDIYIPSDGVVRVEENIEYQFGDTDRHGIIRRIPYKYKKDDNNFKLKIDVTSVTNFSGDKYQYSLNKKDGYLIIKIGDPDTKIAGTHGYRIEYFVNRAVSRFDDYDEFFWNVTGTEWDVPILKASARVFFESDLPGDIKTNCFTGPFGSAKQDCSHELLEESIKFTSNSQLNTREGLTVAVGFPKGIVKGPSKLQECLWFIKDNMVYSVPFITLIGLLLYWRSYGRDPYRNMPIAVRYEPPKDLTPAEAGALYDERADMIDLTSTVVDLAVKGYLRIEEIETTKYLFLSSRDYKLIKLKQEPFEELKEHEKKVIEGLFESDKNEVMVSELKNKFYKNVSSIRDSIYSELIRKKYFISNPDRIRTIYKTIGMIVILASLFILPTLASKAVFALSGLLIVVFSRYMPRKTRTGVEANHHIMGFREFIDKAEKDRIEKLASEDPKVFDRVLPFALVFGLEERWADAFSGMFTDPPEWYNSKGYTDSYSPHIFVNDLGRSIGIMNKSFYSSPKNANGSRSVGMGGGFGGGGFSGGGFGGGGGGSW